MSKLLIVRGITGCDNCPAFWREDDDFGNRYLNCNMSDKVDMEYGISDTSKPDINCPLPDESLSKEGKAKRLRTDKRGYLHCGGEG